ncbi:hypothetical protein V8E54_014540 [Elaphomyces granulatus]
MHNFNDQISDGQYRAMEQSWLSYVHGEREKEGMPRYGSKCNCGKSRTSYPHWPPSCHSEAVDQLRCLLGRSYPHRQYLAHCWLTSLFRKLAVEGTDEIQTMITLVQKICPALQSAGELPDMSAQRHKGSRRIDCDAICQPAIDENDPTCICECRHHREECPVHRVSTISFRVSVPAQADDLD